MELEGEAFQYWTSRLSNRSPSTVKSYVSHLRQFSKWVGKTPDQLIRERREELESDDPIVQHRKETELLRYITYLRDEKGNSGKTQKLAYTAMRSFFGNNHVELDLMPNDAPKVRSSGRRSIGTEEIDKVLQVSSIKWKSLILTLRDSGLRLSDVLRLRMEHVNNLVGEPPIPIKGLLTQKDGSQPVTFLGSESVNALKDWIELRTRGTKILYRGGKGLDSESITADSYLFTTVKGDKMKVSNASRMIVRQMLKAGLEGVTGHSLRKHYQTQFEAAGIPRNWVLRMMGKTLPGSDGSYSMPSEQQLREAYIKAYSNLASQEPIKNEQFLSLQQENEKLHETISQLQEQISQMKEDYWMVRAIRPDASPELKARLRKLILTPDPEMETALRKAEELYPVDDTTLEGKIRNVVKSMLTERNGRATYTTLESTNEEQLLKLLNDGYDIYREINGKIILRR